MTRFGFLALAILLGGGAAVCAIFAVISFGAQLAPATELECDDLARASMSERVRVHGCSLDFSEWMADSRRFDTVTVLAGGGDTPASVLYRTEDPEVRSRVRHLAELEEDDAYSVDRYLERHEAELSRPRTLEGRIVATQVHEYSDGPNRRVLAAVDDGPSFLAAIAMLFALLFGLFFALLVRKQRRWEATRLAWERSQGILVEGGDSPRTF